MARTALRSALVLAVAGVAYLAGALHTREASTQSAAGAPGVRRYACPMHPQYTSDRPGQAPCCGMPLEPLRLRGRWSPDRGSLPSGVVSVTPANRQVAGIRIEPVQRTRVPRIVRTVGRVAPDETRIYRVTAATPGWIEEALPNTVGSLVRKDQRLASFYGREFLGAQQAYLYALDARKRLESQNATDAQMAATHVQVQSSADNLRALGMTRTQLDEIARSGNRVYTIDIRSPATGFILVRNVSEGQRFDPGDELYVVADLRRVWVLADLFERERADVRPHRTVRIHHQDESFEARTADVLPVFDAETRTMKVRLELDNPAYRFRPGMFVDVELVTEQPSAVVVPADAIVDSGLRKTVFVAHGDGEFEPRRIEAGWRAGDRVQVVEGLVPGERIVVSGAFLIDSESRMRAAAAGRRAETAADPVCGMPVDERRASAAGRTSVHDGRTHYFCADQCKKRFDADPAKYADKSGAAASRSDE